jgi:hypothetical protein
MIPEEDISTLYATIDFLCFLEGYGFFNSVCENKPPEKWRCLTIIRHFQTADGSFDGKRGAENIEVSFQQIIQRRVQIDESAAETIVRGAYDFNFDDADFLFVRKPQGQANLAALLELPGGVRLDKKPAQTKIEDLHLFVQIQDGRRNTKRNAGSFAALFFARFRFFSKNFHWTMQIPF